MTLGGLLDQIRAQYLEDFQAKIDKDSAGVGVRLIAEPALRLASGEVAGEGQWKLPMRKDLALLQRSRPARFFDVDARRATTFEAIEFTWGERLDVELVSLRWQQAFVELSGTGQFEWGTAHQLVLALVQEGHRGRWRVARGRALPVRSIGCE